jgi:hypothetical protein
MKVDITLKSEAMRNAFVKALKSAGYSDDEIKKHGDTVRFIFGKPNTKQPITRTKLTDWIIQKKNKHLCDKYLKITENCDTLQDKLNALQEKAPKMYGKITNLGKSKKLYKKCKTINDYLN